MTTFSDQAAAADAMISAFTGTTTTNYGTDTANSGFGEQNNATGATKRFLIKFDLSSIPSNANISSATLSLWVKQDFADNAGTAKMYRLLRNWVESEVTATIYSTGNNWGTFFCANSSTDYDGSAEHASCSFGTGETDGTEMQFTFTAGGLTELKKMIDGTYNNYGWMIKMDTELNDAYLVYTSEEVTQTTRRPKLVIEYTTGETFTFFF